MLNAVIFGCPRSGTSLFLDMFKTLGYRTYFEPGMDFVAQGFLNDEPGPWAMKNPVDHWVTPGLTCGLRRLDRYAGVHAKLWIVRHPLDTICSLLPGLSLKSPHAPRQTIWGHQPYPRNWLQLLTEPPEVRAAALWVWVNELGYMAARTHLALTVRYEDLLAEPRAVVERVCTLLNVPDVAKKQDQFVRTVSRRPGVREVSFQDRWSRPHATHVDRWRTELTPAQVETVLPILGAVPDLYGYDLP